VPHATLSCIEIPLLEHNSFVDTTLRFAGAGRACCSRGLGQSLTEAGAKENQIFPREKDTVEPGVASETASDPS
jgi:hypothetical protein